MATACCNDIESGKLMHPNIFDISNLSLHELQTKWFLHFQAAEESVPVRGILLTEK
jgi:hypothetical protein